MQIVQAIDIFGIFFLLLDNVSRGYNLDRLSGWERHGPWGPKMLSRAKIGTCKESEAILRVVIGAICLALAIIVSGVLSWMLGLAGFALFPHGLFRILTLKGSSC